ncbi:MAG: (2Fe-2S)-binding protein [Psychrobium sp.]
MITLNINNKEVAIDAPPEMPLLYALRDIAQMTGTKFGCGQGLCGACTVHLNGQPIRSCVTPIAAIGQQKVTTIEGLGDTPQHHVQIAWRDYKVPQCGYCQSGQQMSAAALLAQNSSPSDEQIDQHMAGNICRCGTYKRIKAAIKQAGKAIASDQTLPSNAGGQS